jgi:hypothetical protein
MCGYVAKSARRSPCFAARWLRWFRCPDRGGRARANHALTREVKREVVVLHLKADVTIRTSATSRKCAQRLRARADGRRLVARLRDKQCDDSESSRRRAL